MDRQKQGRPYENKNTVVSNVHIMQNLFLSRLFRV